MKTKYDLTHLAIVGSDGIPVFLIPSATPDQKINESRKKERADILRAVNSHEALLAAAKRMKFATMKGFEGEPQDEKEIGLAWEQLTNAIAQAEGK
jgi:hypothetical protein